MEGNKDMLPGCQTEFNLPPQGQKVYSLHYFVRS